MGNPIAGLALIAFGVLVVLAWLWLAGPLVPSAAARPPRYLHIEQPDKRKER